MSRNWTGRGTGPDLGVALKEATGIPGMGVVVGVKINVSVGVDWCVVEVGETSVTGIVVVITDSPADWITGWINPEKI